MCAFLGISDECVVETLISLQLHLGASGLVGTRGALAGRAQIVGLKAESDLSLGVVVVKSTGGLGVDLVAGRDSGLGTIFGGG